MPGTEEAKLETRLVTDVSCTIAAEYNGEDFTVTFKVQPLYKCQLCDSLFPERRLHDHTRWHLNRQKEQDAAKAIQSGRQQE